jgi:hypothetical protein
MASEKLPNVGEEYLRAVDLCHRPSEAGFRVDEKPAPLYFFYALELDGAAIRLGKA